MKASVSLKASVSPASLALAGLLVWCSFSAAAMADILVLSNGQRREVQVIGVSGDRVNFQVGPVKSNLPLSQVQSVTMPPPKAFDEALATWKKGDAKATLAKLRPLVDNFRPLPTPWVIRASALLGEVLLASDDIPGAEKAFADFQKAYPDATGLSELGLARVAVEKKDFATAEAKAAPIADEARKTMLAESGKSAEYGQALYVMGIVQEEQGKLPEALESYLLASTVFYEDSAIATKARERADVLVKEKNVAVP